jgi:hypothetical protein
MNDYVMRTLDEFGMMNYPHDEVDAFASGLRDGDNNTVLMTLKAWGFNTSLFGFYKQGYRHGQEGIRGNGDKSSSSWSTAE